MCSHAILTTKTRPRLTQIDATYLSPSVNNASRIMSANSIYNTTVLLHESVVSLLPTLPKRLARKIDNVYLKGSMEQGENVKNKQTNEEHALKI